MSIRQKSPNGTRIQLVLVNAGTCSRPWVPVYEYEYSSQTSTSTHLRQVLLISNGYKYSSQTSMSSTRLIRVPVIRTHNRKYLAYVIISNLHAWTLANRKRCWLTLLW
jgi:hypothetical protein